MNDDYRLKEKFARLRRADAASVPSFERVIGRTRTRSNYAPWKVGVAAAVVLSAAAMLMVRLAPPRGSAIPAPALANWRAPTDFLLDTPGRDLLRTIPDVGHSAELGPLPPTLMTTPLPRPDREHS